MILKTPVNYGGRLYQPGENVAGKLPLDYLELLRNNGHLDEGEKTPSSEQVVGTTNAEFSLDAAVGEVVKYIEELNDLEELDQLYQLEKEKQRPRSNVLKAIEKRYAELEQLLNSQTLGTSGDE